LRPSLIQVKNTVLDGLEGTGLGLAICKRLVELMKGDIRIKYSKKNSGTCMAFKIPLHSADHLDEASFEKVMQMTEDKTAMILDSQAGRRYQLCQLLINLKMKLFTCTTTEEALLYAAANHIDVILVEPALLVPALSVPSVIRLGETGTGCLKDVSKTGVCSVMMQVLTSTRQHLRHEELKVVVTVPDRNDMRILVVEDNECNVKVAVETLRRIGYPDSRVYTACNGMNAVQLCKQPLLVFDVILMDLKMPIMDGFQATKLILEHYAALKKPPPAVIAMTAFVLGSEREQCKQAGMKGFLPKPILLQELDVMLEVIRKRRNKVER